MFGYVLPAKSELKIREFDVFKGYYCSLCNSIGDKSYLGKLSLTYDMTFLSILLSSIYNDGNMPQDKFCPFKMKKVKIIPANEYIRYAADMNILLAKRKLMDNYEDDKSYPSLIFSKMINTKKISDYSMEKIKSVDIYLNEIIALEKNNCMEIDRVSDCFAKATAEIFIYGDSKYAKLLAHIGYNIGKWIYIIDAVNDLQDDLKTGSYNPLKSFTSSDISKSGFLSKEAYENLSFTLIKCLDEASKAFELLDVKKNKELLQNILYIGMKEKTDFIIRGGKKSEKSIRSIRDKRKCNIRGSEGSI